MKSCLRRPTDLLARYGGEEFVCLLRETDLAGAVDAAQLMKEGVRALALVDAADRAMYLAKAAGRGRVSWVGWVSGLL